MNALRGRAAAARRRWPDALHRFVEADRDAPPPRTLLIVAHPDDEVIGAGGALVRAAANTWIAHVTDGAPRSMEDAHRLGFSTWHAYARARRRELAAALFHVGLSPGRLLELGYPDQGASFALAALTRSVARILAALRPELVLTHAYEGGHPDHDATAFAVHAALLLLERASGPFARRSPAPLVAEMAGYHAAGGSFVAGEFIEPGDAEDVPGGPRRAAGPRRTAPPSAREPTLTVELGPERRATKRAMLDCFVTQQETLAAFGTDVERFRRAPAYDFTRPPHAPPLHYDHFDWGIRSADWCALAQAAMRALERGPVRLEEES